MHGNDLTKEPLEFAMNNQHMNGGIEVDIWGQTSLLGCFAVGEVAGTHGVTRPGGAALNAGQVFAVRLARYIAEAGHSEVCSDIPELAFAALSTLGAVIKRALANPQGISLQAAKKQIQARMSDHAGFICHAEAINQASSDAQTLVEQIYQDGLTIQHAAEITELFMWRHMALTSAAVLAMLKHYVAEGGGSRGARIIIDQSGECLPLTRLGPTDQWRFRPEKEDDKNHKLTLQCVQLKFTVNRNALRDIPDISGNYFEKSWPDFLCGDIYR